MKLAKLALMLAVAAAGVASTGAFAQAKEQFIPLLSYRTGPYAPNGVPWANGKQDYLKLVNARDGGINGVKITFEECETGYATDRGVECYERLKSRPGVTAFDPQATGITFALTDPSTKDYGTGLGTVSVRKGKASFQKFYYEAEFKGGNHGFERCVRR